MDPLGKPLGGYDSATKLPASGGKTATKPELVKCNPQNLIAAWELEVFRGARLQMVSVSCVEVFS